MVDEDSDKGRGQDDGDAKGRTMFGIGLPASVQAATRGGAAPAKTPAVASPAPPVVRPAPPVAKAPPQVDPAAVRQQVSEESPTVEDIRALQRPDDARAPVEEKRTIVGLPGQFGAAPIAATPRSAPKSDATMIDVRAAAASGARQRDTGEFAATRSDVHAATRATQAISQPHEAHREIKAQIKLVAGRPIPGTRYKLLRWLGEGGMGVVYEAEHIDIERRVALKILRSELSQRTDTAQVFRDEARAAARAGSKNIVEIFDFGELPDGRLFFCMELLNGTDLANLIEDNLELPRQLAILRQTCKGLGAAHKAGIVHRDIKPENIILVAHEGRRDMVKIVDFGVSAMLSQDRSDGPIAGTPQYMAPEQINNTQFDGRLDVYALGCVMYEMLAGTTPFPDENLADVLLAHINRAPTRPSQAKPDRQIPKPIEDVVMRCLEKDPQARYRDMADLEAALCEAQIAMGVITEWDDLPLPDVEPERRAALVSRMPSVHGDMTPKKRWWIPVAAAVGAAVVTGVVLMVMGAPEITPEEQAQIDDLSRSAREAASLGHYVNPPEVGGATALVKVKALEAVEGAGEKLADARGLELRTEFSNQLLTIGDKFWETEPTKSLSRDYYLWALAFDPANERALARSARSQSEVADYLKRAEENKLSLSERATGELMVAMMEEDVVAREKQTKRVLARSAKEAPLSAQAALLEAARGAGVAVKAEEVIAGGGAAKEPDKSPETGPNGKADATAGAVEPPVEPVVDSNPEPIKKTSKTGGGGGSGKKKPEGEDEAPLDAEIKRDPVKAEELSGQGKTALSSGRRDEAEKLFNQAIGYDRRNAEALIGLSDIYFDRGSTEKAQKFAERAVNVAPNNGSYRIKLGDAYYSALRYRDALTQYEKAKELGDGKADQRIAKVKAKLGG